MNSLKKDATRDAHEYAAARMSYGEGSGTRRKLIASAVEYKAARIPGYSELFERALEDQDLTKHIKTAKRQRRTKDMTDSASKNIKALARGDKNGMSAPLVVGIVALGVAHQTGLDKKAWIYSKQKVNKARAWLKSKL